MNFPLVHMCNDMNNISEKTCSELRLQWDSGRSYIELADSFDLELSEVLTHVRGLCRHSSSSIEVTDFPWRDKEILAELSIEQNLHFTEMGKILNCHPETVRNWILRNELNFSDQKRTSSKTIRILQRIGMESKEDDENVLQKIQEL
jgi:DNA-directed RNA polymerase specialized sigma24 family protein